MIYGSQNDRLHAVALEHIWLRTFPAWRFKDHNGGLTPFCQRFALHHLYRGQAREREGESERLKGGVGKCVAGASDNRHFQRLSRVQQPPTSLVQVPTVSRSCACQLPQPCAHIPVVPCWCCTASSHAPLHHSHTSTHLHRQGSAYQRYDVAHCPG